MNTMVLNEIKRLAKLQAARDAAALTAWRKLIRDFDELPTGQGKWATYDRDDKDCLCYVVEEYDEIGRVSSTRGGGSIMCQRRVAILEITGGLVDMLNMASVPLTAEGVATLREKIFEASLRLRIETVRRCNAP